MSELRLTVMEGESPPAFSCGIPSIDELIRGSYAKTIFKQALAYNIMVDGFTVGNCMIKFKDKENWYFQSGFRFYPKAEDLRYSDTVPMRMDLINRNLVEKYTESFGG